MNNQTEIESLSDRELDALVAERVLGFDEVERVGGMFYYHNVEMDRESATGGRWRSTVPQFSTEIASAFLVVEKLRADYMFRMWVAQVWNVEVWHYGSDEGFIAGHSHNSLPHAICLAALKATGETK